mmetsp:Transcript_7275/g.13879  ORF Transcript_7275/g.13879 Transcript_7275/m.13879 type:complete len:217 (-) Transcript_7275:893-1543(-)
MPLNHCHPGPVLWLIPFIWPWKLQVARSKRSKPTLSKMHIASLAVFGTVVRATYPDFICPCLSFGCCVFQCAPLSSRNPSAACTEESSPPLGHMGQDKFTHIHEHVEINICSIACRSPAFCKLLPGWCSLGLLKWLEFSLTLHWTRECLVLAGALGTAPHVYFAAVTIVAHCLKGSVCVFCTLEAHPCPLKTRVTELLALFGLDPLYGFNSINTLL